MKLQNITAGYHGTEVLHGVSLSLPQGELVGIIGANGCGKTTLLKCMAGLLPYHGAITYFDRPHESYNRKEFARTVAFLPQTRPIPNLTVRELVAHGRYPHLGFGRRLTEQDEREIDKAIEQMQLGELANRPLSELSGGQRQRAYLALALAQNTKILLLDEPTTYCDIAQQLELMAVLRELCKEGKTVVTVLHELSLALSHCDRLAVLHDGALLSFGTAKEVLQSGAIDTAFGVHTHTTTLDGKTEYFFRK